MDDDAKKPVLTLRQQVLRYVSNNAGATGTHVREALPLANVTSVAATLASLKSAGLIAEVIQGERPMRFKLTSKGSDHLLQGRSRRWGSTGESLKRSPKARLARARKRLAAATTEVTVAQRSVKEAFQQEVVDLYNKYGMQLAISANELDIEAVPLRTNTATVKDFFPT